jgi:sulfur carrier protein
VRFRLNGETRDLEGADGLSVRALLERLELAGRRVAVAINSEVVPRSRFAEVSVREGDAVEVIQAVGGGRA